MIVSMSQAAVPNLDDIETLVKTLSRQERLAINNAKYGSQTALLNDLDASDKAYEAAHDLLEQERSESPNPDTKKESVRRTVWQYVRASLRNGVENFKNMNLRLKYIAEIKENSRGFLGRVEDANAADLAALSKEAADARNATLDFTRSKLSKTGAAFSRWLKENGLDFDQLVKLYTEKAHPGAIFRDLSEADQAGVYTAIIEASGRSNSLVNAVSKAMGIMGAASVLIVLVALTWDVVESENPATTLVKDALELGAGVIGAEVGTELGAAIGAAGGPLGVFLGGILGGLIGGFGGGMAADNLFAAMALGSRHQIPPELTDHSIWGNPVRYIPLMPDGGSLSRSLLPD